MIIIHLLNLYLLNKIFRINILNIIFKVNNLSIILIKQGIKRGTRFDWGFLLSIMTLQCQTLLLYYYILSQSLREKN